MEHLILVSSWGTCGRSSKTADVRISRLCVLKLRHLDGIGKIQMEQLNIEQK